MNIAFLTPFNAICGVAEVSRNLVLELRKKNFIDILANRFAGEYYHVPDLEILFDTSYNQVFDTGFEAGDKKLDVDKVLEVVKNDDCLLVNYQDYLFPDKQGLNTVLNKAKEMAKSTYVMLNDSCLSLELDWGAIDGFIVPPGLKGITPKTKTFIIDQGIPEYEPQMQQRHSQRDYWHIACFGLGRNKTQALIELVGDINDKKLLPIKVTLNIYISKPNQYGEFLESDNVRIFRGYLPQEDLLHCIHDNDACVIWYPDIQARSTSSAFRFAIGAQVPIISHQTNWIADWEGKGVWLDAGSDSKEAYKDAIVRLFQENTYDMTRDRLTRIQKIAIELKGWSVVASLYEMVLSGKMNDT